MRADKQIREAMTADELTEQDRLNAAALAKYVPVEKIGYIVTWVLTGLIAAGCTVTILIVGFKATPPLPWAIAAGIVLFGGLITTGILGHRARRAIRRDQARIVEAAAARVAGPPQPAEDGGEHDPHVNWKKYPVTGRYDPATYYERGGRSTARGMAASGVDDADVYRSNVE